MMMIRLDNACLSLYYPFVPGKLRSPLKELWEWGENLIRTTHQRLCSTVEYTEF